MKKILTGIIIVLVAFYACKNKEEKKAIAVKDSVVTTIAPFITEMMDSVKRNPDSVGLRLQLIDILDSIKNYKEALSQLDSLLLYDSANYNLWIKQGNVLKHAGDTTAAITSFDHAFSVYPAPEVMLELANLFAEKKDKRALIMCDRIEEMRQGRVVDGYSFFFRGVYFARLGDKKKALMFFDKSIISNYTFMDAYIEKGGVLYDEKQFADALKVFKTAATINNTYADAYYWQAKCYEAMKDKDNAIQNYQKALGLDKSIKEAVIALKRLQ